MAYKINYGNDELNSHISNKRETNRKTILFTVLSIFMLLLCLIKPFRSSIENFLIPGNDFITKRAVQNMLNQLKEGQSFGEAFSNFCVEIIDHG